MKKLPFILFTVYSFFLATGSMFAIGEKTLVLGAASSWDAMEIRRGIAETSRIRPHPVLVLAGEGSAGGAAETVPETASDSVDLQLSFDESRPDSFRDVRGRYDVFVSPEISAAAAPLSRLGTGAALFASAAKNAGSLTLKPRPSALFAPGSHIRDFSVEFWLYPLNSETGEQILSWNSSKSDGRGAYFNQQIRCVASKNRLQWNFEDIFFSPGGENRKSSVLLGSPALPRTWSHHLIRFNADTGLLEYLVDGKLEAFDYLTSSGREGGDVFTPVIGEDCGLSLGGRFSGMIDEFRIHRSCLEKPALEKYPRSGGRAESRTIDLGGSNSRLLMIEAFGGRTSGTAGRLPELPPHEQHRPKIAVRNEYSGKGNLRFSDHGEIQFFVRTGDSSYRWNEIPWIPVNPGTELETIRGRYVQIAADFYPGWDGETSPYLSELRLVYHAAEPPPPPARIFAAAQDGAVELSWKPSPSGDVGGYLVYYGTGSGEYFGNYAILETTVSDTGFRPQVRTSPIDAGNRTSIRIEGLNNGTLYYFTVAAYGKSVISNRGAAFVPEPGEFSRETAARPLRMAE